MRWFLICNIVFFIIIPFFSYRQTRIHRPVKCTDCDETFIKSGKLKLHMDRSHPKPGDEKTCHQCDKRFLSDLLLRSHVYKVHTKVYKKIKCDECEDEFKDVCKYI
jgi:hypothetical protein